MKKYLPKNLKENKITIKSDSGLNEAEIERMIKDAEANAEADKKVRELIEARNQADGAISAVKNELAEATNLSDNDKVNVEQAINAVEEAIKGDDKDVITQKVSDLFAASQVIQKAKTAQTEQPKVDDNIVDAEFTEAKTA